MSVVPWKIYSRRTVYFLNANLPLTRGTITEAMKASRPDALYAVPYILKIMAEQVESIEVLRSCREVVTVGSQCPDELGDSLVAQGVPLATVLGATEVGLVGHSLDRKAGDNEWAYLRVPSDRMKHIWPRSLGGDQFEFVFLKDYPTRNTSNADDPPDSFYSKDIFLPHPTIPDAWKYLGRLDDRITLINGEKVLPLPIEGRIKQQPLVQENVVFGVAKPIPGLLVFRSEEAKDMTDEEFVEAIWPDVRAANEAAEGFSQICKDMIVPLPADMEYPQADKGSIIRPQMYQAFEKQIGYAYLRLERHEEGRIQLDERGMEDHLLNLGRELVGDRLESKASDFFTAGVDSLIAIQMRSLIIKTLDLGGNSKKLSHNVVFETTNVENLAKHLYNLRKGHASDEPQDAKIAMQALIQKYSVFPRHVVLLTGVTGTLGSHLLSQLSLNPSVSKIYCLVRGPEPLSRLLKSLETRKLTCQFSKISAWTSNSLHEPSLGLEHEDIFNEIQNSITHVIHAAWPVNFQLPLQSFEPHIQGLHSLINLSLSSPRAQPAELIFCSSISAALGAPKGSRIPESILENMNYALDMGYAQSKFVGEHIVAAAVRDAGARAKVLRIGQVVGDTRFGMWNDREAIPAILRSAMTMGCLPALDMECEWLPVDTVAGCVIELAGLDDSGDDTAASGRQSSKLVNGQVHGNTTDDESKIPKGVNGDASANNKGESIMDIKPETPTTNGREVPLGANNRHNSMDIEIDKSTTPAPTSGLTSPHNHTNSTSNSSQQPTTSPNNTSIVYNLLSPHRFSFTHSLLPSLHSSSVFPTFTTIPTSTWLQRLRTLSSKPTSDPASDPEKNPAIKLVEYYESQYAGQGDEQRGLDGKGEGEGEGGSVFEKGQAMEGSASLRGAEAVIESGLLEKMVGRWMKDWVGEWEGEGKEKKAAMDSISRKRKRMRENEEE
ncbi:MAG: hypothetical protein Q9222_006550 [Ikaeria aurantiellina]